LQLRLAGGRIPSPRNLGAERGLSRDRPFEKRRDASRPDILLQRALAADVGGGPMILRTRGDDPVAEDLHGGAEAERKDEPPKPGTSVPTIGASAGASDCIDPGSRSRIV